MLALAARYLLLRGIRLERLAAIEVPWPHRIIIGVRAELGTRLIGGLPRIGARIVVVAIE